MASLRLQQRLLRRVAQTASKSLPRRRPLSTVASPNTNFANKMQPLAALNAVTKPSLPKELANGYAAFASAVPDKNDLQSVLGDLNERVQPLERDPLGVLRWTLEEFDGRVAMSTSFGIQSAVLLHAATQVFPDIPVVWVDTGYLPKETYEYAEQLREALDLNLVVKSNETWSPARMEAVYGKLWEKEDVESHTLYGRLRKVEPLRDGLDSINPNPRVLLSGLRAAQTKARANMPIVGFQNERFKVLPLLKMTDDEVDQYMDMYDLPQHPLREKGYVTVGDWHSSRPVSEGEDGRSTRFGGKFEECGLHVDEHEAVAETKEATADDSTVDNILKLESAKKTGVSALETTTAHPSTDMAVIMVKKVLEDGSYCRKCNDVSEKMKVDDVEQYVGYVAEAHVLDPESEGSRLAKHFGVVTAPFFLTRTISDQQKGEEWKVVRSYLQLRKQLQNASSAVEERVLAAESEVEPDVTKSHEFSQAQDHLAELQKHVNRLRKELELSETKMRDTKAYFEKKFSASL